MRADPIIRDVEFIVSDLISPEARSARLAEFAAEQIAEAGAINRAAGSKGEPEEVIVDGRSGAPLASVRPDGVIIAEFDHAEEVLEWIGTQLLQASPILTGQYMRSHLLFADGAEYAVGSPVRDASEYIFVSTVPYARKIERGLSDQSPDGVYSAVAAVANKRFGNIARIRFSYRSVSGRKESAERQPAIVVRPY